MLFQLNSHTYTNHLIWRYHAHIMELTADLRGDAAEWAQGATPEQIGLAIMLGYKNVEFVEAARVAMPVEIAQVRGVRGELHVLEALAGEFKCEKVTSRTASGDIQIWYDNVKLMVEVKNYTKPVPAGEVVKFLRDLEACNAACGLFVSLNSRVTGITEGVESRLHPMRSGDMVPIMYACVDDPRIIITCARSVIERAKLRREAAIERAAAHAEVLQIDRAIDAMAHARMQVYELAGSVPMTLAKIASSIQTAESTARECVERIGGIEVEPRTSVVAAIVDALPGNWTSTARRKNHPSGISIDTGKKTPALMLPYAVAQGHTDACIAAGGTVSKDGATIPITADSLQTCLKLVGPK